MSKVRPLEERKDFVCRREGPHSTIESCVLPKGLSLGLFSHHATHLLGGLPPREAVALVGGEKLPGDRVTESSPHAINPPGMSWCALT
jgi:hypothetical protein